MKIDKKLLIISSCLILSPILLGLFFWEQLPDRMATHFNVSGQADGYSSKVFTVFAIPLILWLGHVFCLFMTYKAPKAENISPKIMTLIYWLIPFVTLFAMTAIYLPALHVSLNQNLFGNMFLGLLLIIIGNYLPKTRQNYTIGIKLPWTLADEDNWNKTHRLAGKIWVLGGLVILLNAFLQIAIASVFVTVLVLIVAIPFAYSYWYSQAKR